MSKSIQQHVEDQIEEAIFHAKQLLRAGHARQFALSRACESRNLTTVQSEMVAEEVPAIHHDSN